MTLLDDLSGYEFEETMVRVFEKMGYRDVRQMKKSADKGRDVLMCDDDGTAVIVECKHTDTVSRPVVQKLHSAASTYDHDGDTRGMVVTTGRFTGPAEEYAENAGVELIDGDDLREIGDEIGMDMYNGRIEILCDQTFDVDSPYDTVRRAFDDIENLPSDLLDRLDIQASLSLEPALVVDTSVDAVFETSVGVIHRESDRSTMYFDAGRRGGRLPREAKQVLGRDIRDGTVSLDEDSFSEMYDDVEVGRFEGTEDDYIDDIVEAKRREHSTVVRYTGDNNVTYTKECTPSESDVEVNEIEPVYLPRVRSTTSIQEYDYPYEWYEGSSTTRVLEDGVHRCVQCDEDSEGTYTFCRNCGSINCGSHVKTERLEDDIVCTGCAVTERFMLRTKYFYSEENLEDFRRQYNEMPIHQRLMENKPLVFAVVVSVLVAFGLGLRFLGVV